MSFDRRLRQPKRLPRRGECHSKSFWFAWSFLADGSARNPPLGWHRSSVAWVGGMKGRAPSQKVADDEDQSLCPRPARISSSHHASVACAKSKGPADRYRGSTASTGLCSDRSRL